MSTTTDSDEAPLSVTIEDRDDLHPEAEAVVGVIYGSIDVVEVLAETPTDAIRGSGWTREDIRLFEDAYRSGHSLLDGLGDAEITATGELMQQYDLDDMVEADVAELAEDLEDSPGF